MPNDELTYSEKLMLETDHHLMTDCIRNTPHDTRCRTCPSYRLSDGLYFCDIITTIQKENPVKRCECGVFSYADGDYCWKCGAPLGESVLIHPRVV